jgi:hypothetical protein
MCNSAIYPRLTRDNIIFIYTEHPRLTRDSPATRNITKHFDVRHYNVIYHQQFKDDWIIAISLYNQVIQI